MKVAAANRDSEPTLPQALDQRQEPIYPPQTSPQSTDASRSARKTRTWYEKAGIEAARIVGAAAVAVGAIEVIHDSVQTPVESSHKSLLSSSVSPQQQLASLVPQLQDGAYASYQQPPTQGSYPHGSTYGTSQNNTNLNVNEQQSTSGATASIPYVVSGQVERN
jgi:hypothetical protein